MASPDPKRQKTTIAQGTLPPKNIRSVVLSLKQELKSLKPVNFTYHTFSNPYSLPDSFGRIFYQEGLTDIEGNPLKQNVARLAIDEYRQKLAAKLTYVLIRSQFIQQLFQICQSTATTTGLSRFYLNHYHAFGRLFADHYSYFPTDTYMELRYPQLFSLKKALNRYPMESALTQAGKNLFQALEKDKENLIKNLQAFLEAADSSVEPKTLLILNRKIIDQIMAIFQNNILIIDDFNILLHPDEFPKIAVQYILPATK